jgi:hypothetical protein
MIPLQDNKRKKIPSIKLQSMPLATHETFVWFDHIYTASKGGGNAKTWVGSILDKDFINIFKLILCKKNL